MLAKLSGVAADGVVLDLEDGVAPADKDAARDAIRAAALPEGDRPAWMVRVNPLGTSWHEGDLALCFEIGAPRVVLPKAEDPGAVADLARRCERAGARVGLVLETAGGVGRARALLAAHPGVDLAIYGAADYRLSIGARPAAERTWERHALAEILLAARMSECTAIDAVYFRYRDRDGLLREAAVARELGFDGKSCIHPDQIAPIHEIFSSTPDELEWAVNVRRAWADQDGDRQGVAVLDGEMIEALHLRLADRILARAPDR
jgi:citrate lyase subunit beta / citryl-CoA lyase